MQTHTPPQHRLMAEAVPHIVWTTDSAGAVTFFSRRWYDYTGMDEAASRDFGFVDALHPDDRERTLRIWEHSWRSGEPYAIEYRLRRHDKSYRWFMGRATPVRNEAGAIIEWVGTCTDIDDQKRGREALAFLAEASAMLADSLDYEKTLTSLAQLAVPHIADWCAIDLCGADGEIRRLAAAHVDPTKVALAEAIYERYPHDPHAPGGVPAVIRTGQPEFVPVISEEMVREGIDDPEMRAIFLRLGLRSSMVVPLTTRGRTLGALTLVAAESGRYFAEPDLRLAKDLARRAAVAIEHAELYGDLRASEQRFRALADAMPLLVWIADARGGLIDVNRPWRDYTGVTIEQIGPFGWDSLVHPDDLTQTTSRWQEAVAACAPFEVEQRLRNAAGAYRWHLVRAQAVRDQHGQVAYWVGTNTDIDEQKRAEAAALERSEVLAHTTRLLEERNRELDQFAYVTSHDLKAPLRGMANLAQWIEEDLGAYATAEIKGQLELLRGRAHRMEALIDGILLYSRVGRAGDKPEPIAVGALLAEVVDLLAPPPTATICVTPDLPTLLTDRVQLSQVFANLIGNALKHADRPDPTITVAARRLGRFYEFSVADDGPGIAPQYHERIFGIFQTLASRDRVEGSGLGLALVKKIVERQGGQVRVASAEGQGATFAFTWPYRLP